MAATSQQLIERAIRRSISQPNEEQLLAIRSSGAVLFKSALEALGAEIARGPNWKGMQKDFPVTPVLGSIDLTAAATADIIFMLHRSRIRIAATNASLIPIDDQLTLEHGGLSGDHIYYTVQGNDIRILNTDGTLNTYVTQVKVTANFVPALANITLQYEEPLIALLSERLLAAIQGDPRLAMSEAQAAIEGGRAS